MGDLCGEKKILVRAGEFSKLNSIWTTSTTPSTFLSITLLIVRKKLAQLNWPENHRRQWRRGKRGASGSLTEKKEHWNIFWMGNVAFTLFPTDFSSVRHSAFLLQCSAATYFKGLSIECVGFFLLLEDPEKTYLAPSHWKYIGGDFPSSWVTLKPN